MKIRPILMLGWLLGLAAATGQEAKPEAPNASKPEIATATDASAAKEGFPTLYLRLETWQAPALEVAKRLDGIKNSEDLAKLRAECLSGPPGVALVLSSAINVNTPSQVIAESVTERIYPTEYEPPSLSCPPPTEIKPGEEKPAGFDEWLEKMAGRATPTAFETRNTDTILEAEISPADGQDKTWSAKISVEDVRYLGRENFGAEELGMGMPAFSAFRTASTVRLKEGKWQILSILEPPRGLESKPSDKRWITLVRIDPQE
ncbi:MAG: hypothetical protein EOP83_01255 [Verrucomicrobiaceae bacterium]|nr:MAG: hypothetical protein EOP83_01255 [Verrucomicrobiaceae bacterium]